MKKSFYSLFLLFISFQLQSQEIEKLPKIPWEEIIEITSNKDRPFLKWKEDINVSLKGNYTSKDSLHILKFIHKLDKLTETITIRFSDTLDSNLTIQFIDYESTRGRTAQYSTDLKTVKNLVKADVYIYNNERENAAILLKARIASVIVKGSFINPQLLNKRVSIFNSFNLYNKKHKDLHKQDYLIINKVYGSNFNNNLHLAKKKFFEVVENMKNAKIERRDRSLWWVKNPVAIIFIPALLLFLLFLFFTFKIKNYIESKLSNSVLRFLLVSLIAVCFIDIIIIFSVSFYDFLTTPLSFGFSIVRFDTVISKFIVSLFCFPFLFLFRFLENKIEKIRVNIIAKTSLIFISTGFLPFLFTYLLFLITTSKASNLQGGYGVLANVFITTMIIATIRSLISYFIFKERNLIVENEKQLSNLRELKAKAELKSLQSQINPHFLYNSLNSIASLAPIDAVKTQKMAHSLSDLFKYSINRKGKNMSTIKEEIEMVNSYLEIEKIRFGDRLQFKIEVSKEIENYEIPLFLIQPLVENAVKHGISQNEGNGKIVLKIDKNANELIISISDNGPNFSEGLVSGHGLQTVYDLLRLSYGENASLNWTNTPQKIITITILETVSHE